MNPGNDRARQGFRIARTSFLTFLGLIVLSFFWVVLRPLLPPIVLAILVAVIFYPVHEWVEKHLGGRKIPAAIASMGLLSLFVVVPLVTFVTTFVVQVRGVLKNVLGADPAEFFSGELLGRVEGYLEWLAQTIAQYTGDTVDLRGIGMKAVQAATKALYTNLPDILGYAGSFVLAYFLLCIVLFFLFLQGTAIVDMIVELSPMSDRYDRQILQRLARVIQAVFVGALLTSTVQGAIGMVGFLVVGIHNAIVWGGVMAFCSLIPVVGTALIWGPAAVYLWLEGSTGSAVTVLVFGAIIVGSDNIIRPLFMRGKAAISPLLIFLAIFGGLQTAGPMGLIYGPLLAATVVEAIRIYRSDFMIPDSVSAGYVPPPIAGARDMGGGARRRRRRKRRFQEGNRPPQQQNKPASSTTPGGERPGTMED